MTLAFDIFPPMVAKPTSSPIIHSFYLFVVGGLCESPIQVTFWLQISDKTDCKFKIQQIAKNGMEWNRLAGTGVATAQNTSCGQADRKHL